MRRCLSLALGAGCLYSPGCREEKFSETELPTWGVLGNSGKKRAGAVRPRPSLLSREDVAEKPSLAEDFTENLLGCAPHTVVHGFCHATEDWVDDVVGDGIHDLAYTVGSGTYDFSSPF